MKIHPRQVDKSRFNTRRAVGSVELTVAHLVTFSQFYGTRKFTAVFKFYDETKYFIFPQHYETTVPKRFH